MGSKYRNKKVSADGFMFDSKAEAARYYQLKILLHAKKIEHLEIHPAWDIKIGGMKICRYVADFSYRDIEVPRGQLHFTVEDVKGVKTPTYRIKKKLMKAVHGIDVVEIAA